MTSLSEHHVSDVCNLARAHGLCFLLIVVFAITGCRNQYEAEDLESSHSSLVLDGDSVPINHRESVIKFEDIASRCGVDFVPANGRDAGRYTILESLGTGIALMDFDHDGNLDIVAPGGGAFNNDGLPIGRECGVFRQTDVLKFRSVLEVAGLSTGDTYTHGVAVGDIDNDGFPDVLITGFHSLHLFKNHGDGTFAEITRALPIKQTSWSTSAAFLDADGDGDLECYVTNYVDWSPKENQLCVVKGHRDICPPSQFEALSDWLFDNNGDGTFREVSEESGLAKGGKGLAVISGDVDLDGDTDIYVANDTNANFLYLNHGDGRFEEQALVAGCALGATLETEGSMGVDLADFNLDGLPDIWVANYENQSFAMYQSRMPGVFQHVSGITGISSVGQLYVGFGTVAFDADLDGDVDIFAANGHVMYESDAAPVRQLPLIYENLGGKSFRNVAQTSGDYGRSIHMGRGVAAGDIDRDGLVDLVVSHTNEPIAILRNTSKPQRSWVHLELIGTMSNRSGIGAYVVSGQETQLLRGGGSYLSSNSNWLTCTLPFGTETAEIQVYWSSGQQRLRKIRAYGRHSIVENLVNVDNSQ